MYCNVEYWLNFHVDNVALSLFSCKVLNTHPKLNVWLWGIWMRMVATETELPRLAAKGSKASGLLLWLRLLFSLHLPVENCTVCEAKGLWAIVSNSTWCLCCALRLSNPDLNLQTRMQTAKNRKKQEKKTEKKTNKSICNWSWRKCKKPKLPPESPWLLLTNKKNRVVRKSCKFSGREITKRFFKFVTCSTVDLSSSWTKVVRSSELHVLWMNLELKIWIQPPWIFF